MTSISTPARARLRVLAAFAITASLMAVPQSVGAVPANLDVTVTPLPSVVAIGDTVDFEIEMVNNGNGTERVDYIASNFGPELAFNTCDGTPSGTDCVYAVNISGRGGSFTATITADVIGPPGVVNPTFDLVNGGNSANHGTSVTIIGPEADLSVTKAVVSGDLVAGDTETYRVTVENGGPTAATAPTLADTLPPDFTFVGATGDLGPAGCSGTTVVTCELADIPAGGNAVVDLNVSLDPSISAGTTARNTVEVATVPPSLDPDPSNNSYDLDSVVSTQSVMTLLLADDPDPVIAGSVVTYTATVGNSGPSDATGVQLDADLPAGTGLDGTAPTGCTGAGTSWLCDLPDLTVGTTTQIEFDVAVPMATTPGVDVLEFAGQALVPAGTPSSVTSEFTSVLAASADLELTKVVDPTSIAAGDGNVTYTLTVTNNGPSTATAVEVTDTLPTELTLVSVTPDNGTTCTDLTPCTIGDLDPDDTVEIDVIASVNADANPGTVLNSASVTSPVTDPNPDNNTAQAPLDITSSADLELTKVVDPTSIAAGDGNVTYTLTVTNNGPSTATAVEVTDTLPTELTLVSVTPDNGTTCTDLTPCTIGDLDPDDTVEIDVIASVNADANPGTVLNSASVTSPVTDPNPDNNTAQAPLDITSSADLELTKVVDPTSIAAGDGNVTYTLTVTNNGPSTATAVEVTDTLPTELTLVSVTPDNGTTCTDLTPCTIGDLDPDDTVEIDVIASVNADANPGTVLNSASVTSPVTDPNPDNNTAQAPLDITSSADLELTKVVDPTSIAAGDGNVTYTLTVTNNGPSTATAVEVTDTLPTELTLVSVTPDNGTTCTDLTPCTIGDLDPDDTVEIDVIASVNADANPGTVLNSASVTSPVTDPNPDNNTAQAPLDITSSADLELTKVAMSAAVVAGGNASYTLTVTNNGPSEASGVTVTDSFADSNLTLVSAAPETGSCSGTTSLSCDLGDMAPGTTIEIDVVGAIDPATPAGTDVDNTASVTSPVTDPNPDNNTATETVTVSTPNNLEVTKTKLDHDFDLVPQDSVVAGSDVEYLIRIDNPGPSVASSPEVVETLPSELDLVSATVVGGAGTCTGTTTVTCSLADIAPGGSTFIEITAALPSDAAEGTEIVNMVAATVEGDPTPATDETTNIVSLVAPLSISFSPSPDPAVAGEPVTVIATITNDGPSDIPAASPVTGDFAVATGNATWAAPTDCADVSPVAGYERQCALGALVAGGSVDVTLTLDVAVDAAPGTDELGLAYLASTEVAGADPEGTFLMDIIAEADLTLIKTLDVTEVSVGDTGTYTLTVTNNGPSLAPGVIVTDGLPVEVTYLSSAASTGSYDDGTGQWAVGDLEPDDSATLTITVRFDGVGEFENTASASSDATDPTPADAVAVAGVVVVGVAEADLVLTKTVSARSVVTGDSGTYTVTVTNAGPSPATGVVVTEALPSGVTLVSGTPSQGDFDGATWTVGDLANGGSATLTLEVTFDEAGSITNSASAASETDDPDTGSNVASVTVTVSDPLPETGLDADQYAVWGSLLILFGLFVVMATNRRGQRA